MTKSYHLIRSRKNRLSSRDSIDGLMDASIVRLSDKMSRKRISSGSPSSFRTTKLSSKSVCDTKGSNHIWILICSSCVLIVAIFFYEYRYTLLNILGYVSQFGSEENLSDLKNGGWRLADVDILHNYDSNICTIDRKYANDLDENEFEKVYRHKKPLILRFENGANDWTKSERWSVESLRKEYGEWFVMSGNAREIVRHGGTGYIQTSFSQYIDTQMNERDAIGEPMYVFDRDFYNDSSLPLTLKPPNYLKIKDGVDDSIFFLGMSGSGVSFHKHADAWNGVIFGRKRWFLFPIEKTPPGGVYPAFTQQEWYKQIYPHLKPEDKMLECIQEAGEILYLPESWYHGTINLGDTVAIGIQKKEAKTSIEKLFYKEGRVTQTLRNKDETGRRNIMSQRLKMLEEILRMLPDNAEVHMKTGSIYKELGNLPEAERLTSRAIELDKYFVVAMLNLAGIEYQLGKHQKAIELYKQAEQMAPNLWDVYAQYGDFLLNTQRPSDAAEMYKKGTLLQPDSIQLWTQVRYAQLMANDQKGADISLKEINRIKET